MCPALEANLAELQEIKDKDRNNKNVFMKKFVCMNAPIFNYYF